MYGGPSTGKTHTMVGHDDSNLTVGILPCAISWLYNLINDCKERTGARISVRVSAVEVVGKNETLKDLLAEQTSGNEQFFFCHKKDFFLFLSYVFKRPLISFLYSRKYCDV